MKNGSNVTFQWRNGSNIIIKVYIASQESDRSCICVLGVSFCLFLPLYHNILEFFRPCGNFRFSFYYRFTTNVFVKIQSYEFQVIIIIISVSMREIWYFIFVLTISSAISHILVVICCFAHSYALKTFYSSKYQRYMWGNCYFAFFCDNFLPIL